MKGIFIQLIDCYHSVNEIQDLGQPFINICGTDEDLRREIQKARNWMDTHSLIHCIG